MPITVLMFEKTLFFDGNVGVIIFILFLLLLLLFSVLNLVLKKFYYINDTIFEATLVFMLVTSSFRSESSPSLCTDPLPIPLRKNQRRGPLLQFFLRGVGVCTQAGPVPHPLALT